MTPFLFRRCAFEIEMGGMAPAHGNVSGEGETEYWSVLEIGKSLGAVRGRLWRPAAGTGEPNCVRF